MTENFNLYLQKELAYNLNRSSISQRNRVNSVATFRPVLNDPLINLFNKNKQKIKFLDQDFFEKNKITEYLRSLIRRVLPVAGPLLQNQP